MTRLFYLLVVVSGVLSLVVLALGIFVYRSVTNFCLACGESNEADHDREV